jgi:hypothetical protein
MRLQRLLFSFIAAAFLLQIASVGRGEGAISFSDLDLSKVQADSGPVGDVQSRTENGMVLAPGQSLWVDLKRDAELLKCTVQPLPGSRGAPVRCRFATPTYIWDVTVEENGRPIEVEVPLSGQSLLVVECCATDKSGNGIRIHITPSSIFSKHERPEAWGGMSSIEWKTPEWDVRIDGRSGGLTRISNPQDTLAMQWLRPATSWGTGWFDSVAGRKIWNRPTLIRQTDSGAVEVIYDVAGLRIRVRRTLDAEKRLRETYTFENTGAQKLVLPEGSLGIYVPVFDSYPGADLCLTQRCHAHLWMGGSSAYVNALRMGGAAPHLGLVLTDGNLTSYSIEDHVDHSNDRGVFVVHPPAQTLEPGASFHVSWVVFWHDGWDDFYTKAAASGYVRLKAERYTVTQGSSLKLQVNGSAPIEKPRLFVNTTEMPIHAEGAGLHAEIPMHELGEQNILLRYGNRRSLLRAYVAPPELDLVKARVRFIIRSQQKRAPREPLDGAYLSYDNEKNELVYDPKFSDHNAGRERLAMGTLVALYRKSCDDQALSAEIDESLSRYAEFVERELQNPLGDVFDDVRRSKKQRMYNYPWVIQFHLAMHEAYGDAAHLRRALETCRRYYARGGERFYCIGMPILQLLGDLRAAGWDNEYKEVTALFRKHANSLLQTGTAFPKHEVNYEQSIVGPAAQILLEFYLATKEPAYLEGAKQQVKLLELFNGQQPDYHLNEIAIRHWDDFWFGGRRLYGDTFPHYWSTITGQVSALFAQATGDVHYQERASQNLLNNLCAFAVDGRASAAYVYPLTVNGKPGRFFDPWANDQDWALVAWMRTLGPAAKR